MKSIERFLDNVSWLFYGLIPALYLSIQSSIFSYKYRLFPDFIFVYVLAIIFALIIFLIFRMFSKYHDLKKGKSTIFSTIFSYFSFPLLSSCVTAIFLFFEFKSVDRNAIFPYLFNYLLIQFFSWVLFIVIWYYKEEKRALELAKFENTQETQSELSVNSTELQEEKAKNTQLQAENERLKAELKAQQDRMAEIEQKLQQGAVDSEPVLEKGKVTRISKIQRDIFTLLILKNYQGMESRNALFDVINADLKEQGINNKGASYQTFDNLIDENIRLTKIGLDGKQISHSPFPSKITK